MIESDLFATSTSLRHKFFTREGGVSDGLYASLNCGIGSSDRVENVFENRRRASEALGVSLSRLVTLSQVHGANVIAVSDPAEVLANRRGRCHGYGSTGRSVGDFTADCAPVIASRHPILLRACWLERCIIWCYRKHDLSDAKTRRPARKYHSLRRSMHRPESYEVGQNTGPILRIRSLRLRVLLRTENGKINSIFAGTFCRSLPIQGLQSERR